MKKYTSLGELLLDYRKQNNLSQSDLAIQLDVDVRTVLRWEKNETLLKSDKEEELVDITFIPYQVIRNLNAPVSIPTYYDLDLRRYSLSLISNDLPEADWVKDKRTIKSDRLRTIKYDADIDSIIRCSLFQKEIFKPIQKDIIKKAVQLLPELNIVIYDSSGYYSGHSIFLPITFDLYQKIRNRTMKEEDITINDLIDYKNVENPVFYAYDIQTDCNENLFYIGGEILSFFETLDFQYTYASYTSRNDTYRINEQIGASIVWEDKALQHIINSSAPPRLYEGSFKRFFEK